MILKALYDYYKRKESILPAFGTEMKEIHYIIILDKDGKFVRFESKRMDKKHTAQFCVAKGYVRTCSSNSNILWDKGKYVFGLKQNDKEYHDLFVGIVEQIASNHKSDPSIQALSLFMRQPNDIIISSFKSDALWDEVSKNLSCNFSFQLEGDDRIIAEKTELFMDSIDSTYGVKDSIEKVVTGICLITGERGPIIRLTTPTPILNCKPLASLVGVQTGCGYDSYGKTQVYNSPISVKAEFAYSTTLKTLLAKDSKNRYTIGQRVFLFWASKDNEVLSEAESLFLDFLNVDFVKSEDNPNQNVKKIEKFFKAIWSGEIKTNLEDRFYFLGIAPNKGRESVVYFEEISLKDFAEKLIRHFADMEIVDFRPVEKQRPYCGLYSILSSITLRGKVANAIPNLSETILYAMLNGTEYPYQLLTSTIQRICAENLVTTGRAGILKAYINRKSHNKSSKITVMLDTSNNNPGYLCGRLTAVLEKIQSDANSGDSIKTRYMTAASATPSAVFPSMLNLSMHHMDKLSEGSKIFYEQIKQEILDKMPADGFPAHLDLADQGRFFVGYYHQRAKLYESKKSNEK